MVKIKRIINQPVASNCFIVFHENNNSVIGDPQNAADYYACKQVVAVGGSWMAPADLIEAEEYRQITQMCKEAVALYKRSK